VNQPNFNQPNFNQPNFNQAPIYQVPTEDTTPLSTGQWMLTTLVLALPCIGLIMAFVWAFGNGNVNRRNYSRATLIWMAISIGIALIGYGIVFTVFRSYLGAGAFSSIYY
jgi:hypothetical protein